jgi:putative DNA primase/helicase
MSQQEEKYEDNLESQQEEKYEENEDVLNETLKSLQEWEPEFNYTDLGNGRLYSKVNHEKIGYIPETEEWIVCDKSMWETDKKSKHYDFGIQKALDEMSEPLILFKKIRDKHAAKCSTTNYNELKKKENLTLDEEIYLQAGLLVCRINKWLNTSEMHTRMNAMLTIAQKNPQIARNLDEFDTNGDLLGVQNGVVDVRKGTYRPADGSDLILKRANVKYEKDADCPEFKKFVTMIMSGNDGMVSFIQEVLGQCLVADKKSNVFLPFGIGSNGKSTLFDFVSNLLGDYARVTDKKVFDAKVNEDKKEYYKAQWRGSRLLQVNEFEKNTHIDEGMVKDIVENDGNIVGRHPSGRPFTFKPFFTPVIITNHKPRITASKALKRRIVFIPFNHIIPDNDKNTNFASEVLDGEKSGIFNWILEGCVRYCENGLTIPEHIKTMTEEIIDSSDPIESFIQTALVPRPDKKLEMSDIRKMFVVWAEDNGHKAMSTMALRNHLEDHGLKVLSDKGKRHYAVGYGYNEIWLRQHIMDRKLDDVGEREYKK